MSKVVKSEDHPKDAFGAQAWRPEPGESLIGQIVSIYTRVHEGREFTVCRVLNEEHKLLDIPIDRVVLVCEFKKLNPQIGDSIAIKCMGKRPEKKYIFFRVLVQRASETNWNDVLTTEEPEPNESAA